MNGADYTELEVVWLLSIDRETARNIDAEPADSFPDLLRSNYQSGALCASDERPLLTVLRWHDVHDARERISPLIDEDVLELRLEGLGEDQVALVLERSQQTVSRLWLSSVDSIVRELNSPQFLK